MARMAEAVAPGFSNRDHVIHRGLRQQEETVWLTQPLMAELFQTTQQNISQHIQNIYEEGADGFSCGCFRSPAGSLSTGQPLKEEGLYFVGLMRGRWFDPAIGS